jgi:carbamoylphosphate synthase small subunit
VKKKTQLIHTNKQQKENWRVAKDISEILVDKRIVNLYGLDAFEEDFESFLRHIIE